LDPWLWLGVSILLASVISTIGGFGAIIIALALGAFVLPISTMLPVVVPLNLFLTGTIAWKNRRQIDRTLLLRLVLPFMALGTAAGYFLRPWLGEDLLKTLLGLLIVWFALRQTWRLVRETASRPHPPWLTRVLTLLAGTVHGLFASGGPLLVYAMAGKHLDKGRMRASLVTVWTTLNFGLTIAFLIDGMLIPALPRIASYLPLLAAGYLLGDFLHHRLDERRFRQTVYVMLIVTGAALIIR
jgi:hypothetical protein